MKLPSLYLVALSTLLSGCVGRLQTTPYLERTDRLTSALPGVTYSLPKLQYKVKLTRYLAECPAEARDDGEQTALKFAVNIEATPQYVPGEAYTIDYEQLSGFTRTSNFEIKYWPNGNLKSVGAGAEDQTAEILKDVVKTGLAIASATQGGPSLPLASPESSRSPGAGDGVVCTNAALKLVKDRRDKAQKLEENAGELKKLQVEIERIEKRATLKLVNRKDREALLKLFGSVDTETAKGEDLKKELATLTGKLAVADEFTWDSDITQPGAGQNRRYDLLPDQTKKLAGLLEVGPLAPLTGEDAQGEAQRKALFPACFARASVVNECIEQQLNLRATVALQAAVPKCPPEKVGGECWNPVAAGRPARDPKPDDGLFVREPAHGRLLFCRAQYPACTTDVDEAGMTTVYFPQLGQLRYLPLKVGTFQAKNMTLLMTEDGRVESFSYNSTKAPGQVLASAAADIATQVDAALEKRETERRDDRAYARAEEAAGVQSEIDRLTKELELRKAKEALAPDPLKPLNDETAVMKAEVTALEVRLAKLKAESALAEASAAPGG